MRFTVTVEQLLCGAALVLLAGDSAADDSSTCKGVSPIKTDIVIIGAGVAGIRAAARVLEVDPTLDVTILESTDRIGGRVESRHGFGKAGVTIQKGANWIYNDGNIIFEMAANASLAFTKQDFTDLKAYEYDPIGVEGCAAQPSGSLRKLQHRQKEALQQEPAALGRLLRTLEEDDSVDAPMKLLITRFLRRELHSRHHEKQIQQ